MKYKILIITQFIVLALNAQIRNKIDAQICTWQDDKQGAISISFDDASFTQYKYAFPILEKHKLNATFSLVGEWTKEKATYSAEEGSFEIKKMGWNELKELKQAGNEIAAHGFTHKKYNKNLPKDTLVMQMKMIKNYIEKHLNSPIYTLHFPYSATSPNIINAAKNAGFLYSRTYESNINESSPTDMNHLVSKAIVNNSTPNNKQLQNWIKEADNKWLILMYHHLFPPLSKEMKILKSHNVTNTYSVFPSTFEKQMQIVSNSKYMIAPIATIGKYITERNNTTIKTKKLCKKIKLKTITTLEPEIYDVPLSIKVHTTWKKISIKGTEQNRIIEVKNNQFLIKVIPGNTVIIKKL